MLPLPAAAERHRQFDGTELCCLATEAHVCDSLGQTRYTMAHLLGVERRSVGQTHNAARVSL